MSKLILLFLLPWPVAAFGQSIGEFLSGLGLSIGPDANAATRYDDTQYTLRVPTDVPGVRVRMVFGWTRLLASPSASSP